MENKNRNTAAIGVFDSGVGGLTVTREIMRQLPNENVVYFGDTARVRHSDHRSDRTGSKSCRKGDQEWSDWCTWYRSNDQERDLYQRNPETYAGGRSHRKAMSVIRTVGRRRICKA